MDLQEKIAKGKEKLLSMGIKQWGMLLLAGICCMVIVFPMEKQENELKEESKNKKGKKQKGKQKRQGERKGAEAMNPKLQQAYVFRNELALGLDQRP